MVLYSSSPADGTTDGGLAQLGERLHGMQEVTGSIPVISTKRSTTQKCVVLLLLQTAQQQRGFRSAGRAGAWAARGHRDLNSPAISTKRSTTQKCVVLLLLQDPLRQLYCSPSYKQNTCGLSGSTPAKVAGMFFIVRRVSGVPDLRHPGGKGHCRSSGSKRPHGAGEWAVPSSFRTAAAPRGASCPDT